MCLSPPTLAPTEARCELEQINTLTHNHATHHNHNNTNNDNTKDNDHDHTTSNKNWGQRKGKCS